MREARKEKALPEPEVSIGRIRPRTSPHWDAARAWLERWQGNAPGDLIRRLANTYRVAARRVPADTSPQLLFSFFNALARNSEASDLSSMLFALRTLRHWPQQNVWTALLQMLDSPAGLSQSAWWRIHDAASSEQSLNDGAAVTFDEMRRVLEAIGPVFQKPGTPRIAISPAPDSRDTMKAWTDGKAIYLPERINLAQDRNINRWMYMSLLAHESSHIQFGTYDFDPASPKARSLFRKFDQTFPDGHPARNSQEFAGAVEWPTLHRFLLRFHEPAAAKYLQNLLEDIRVDEKASRKYRTTSEAAGLLEMLGQRRNAAPGLLDAKQSFLAALYSVSRNLPVVTHISKGFAKAWEKVRLDLQSWSKKPGRSIYETLEAMIDLYRDLHDLIDPRIRDEFFQFLSFQEASGFRQVVANLLNDRDHSQTLLPVQPFTDLLEPGWMPLPEYDTVRHILVDDAVWIEDAGRNQAPRGTTIRNSGNRKGYVESGRDLELSRAYDFTVAVRMGVEPDERVFHRPAVKKDTVPETFTFFIDLSVSMGVPARWRTRTPLAKSTAFLASVIPELERKGIATAILGGFDLGGRPFTVHRIKGFGEPLDAKALRNIQTVGLGGFRIGAVIRYVNRLLLKHEGNRNRLLILTDEGPHYVHQHVNKLRKRFSETCGNCASRFRCPHEPLRFPPRGERGNFALPIYQPIEHEDADIRAALRETAGKLQVSIHPRLLNDERLVPFFPGGAAIGR